VPFAISRLLLFGAVYLLGQVVGVLALGGAWVWAGFGLRRPALIASTYLIQRAWVATLLGSVKVLYGIRFELEGQDELGSGPGGPAVILMQHTSLVDTLLPTTFLTARRGLKLRWVLKKELLVDPALDIAGNRLPNAFVGRDGSDTARALAQIEALSKDLTPSEGVLIYPEGTRYTRTKRERALARIQASSPVFYERAARLERVLPPRLGGPVVAITTASHADVIFVGHIGFEGLATARAVLSGGLVGRTVRIRFWRIPRAQIPTTREALIDWLWQQWATLDAWVAAQAEERPDRA
jgi:1-acyl-sn-glycerol-3-phosphate acyltransferase